MNKKAGRGTGKAALRYALIFAILALCVVDLRKQPASEPVATPHASKAKVVLANQPLQYAAPIRLKIPKLRIDAPVVPVGLTASGNMDVPGAIADAGWYQNGVYPGDPGSAVIAGHVVGFGNVPGVFLNLGKLRVGDSLQTFDQHGRIVSFQVTKMQSYDFNARPSEVFESASGAHLNLITCAGTWDASEGSFTKRLVVFADKVD